MTKKENFMIRYRFQFPEGLEKVFDVELDSLTGELVQPERQEYPKWTLLEYKQCGHCPLKKETHTHCPVAVSIIDIVEFFYDSLSVKKTDVVVETKQRTTSRGETALFPAISSLLGIHMASSGCPIMSKLRPMVRHHLPFADADETIYRALSMYVLAQYFRRKEGQKPDWGLEGLSKIYQDINALNIDFSRRLVTGTDREATTNAITSLDCFAQIIEFSITEEMLEEQELLFKGYLNREVEV